MKKKKSLIAIVAVLLIAIVGTTFALFQSSAQFRNVFTTGIYRLVTTEEFESPSNWTPGDEIPKTIVTKNEGTIPAAVRVSYTEQWLDGDTDITANVPEGTVIINLDNQEDWEEDNGYYYYKYILNPEETTSSFIKSVTLNPNLNGINCSNDGAVRTCESSNPALGATYKLIIRKETIQYDRKDEWGTVVDINQGSSNTPSCTPKYFENGDPTTSSPTNYQLINRQVMGALCEDGTKGVCIVKNNNLECFMNNNYNYEKEHLRSLYPNVSCDGSNILCKEDSFGFTIKDDFSCTLGLNGEVGCGTLNTDSPTDNCRTNNGTVSCSELDD